VNVPKNPKNPPKNPRTCLPTASRSFQCCKQGKGYFDLQQTMQSSLHHSSPAVCCLCSLGVSWTELALLGPWGDGRSNPRQNFSPIPKLAPRKFFRFFRLSLHPLAFPCSVMGVSTNPLRIRTIEFHSYPVSSKQRPSLGISPPLSGRSDVHQFERFPRWRSRSTLEWPVRIPFRAEIHTRQFGL
jgi:hypothetical protein